MKKQTVKVIGLLIFSFVFYTIRLPFLNYLFIPNISADTFDYFNFSYQMHLGKFPDFAGIPPLYPLLYFFTSPFGASFLIYFQILFSFLAFLLLLRELNNSNYFNPMINTIFIILLSSQSYILQFETSFLTESIYLSLFILLSINILKISNSNNNRSLYITCSLLVFLIAFTRSNGIYLYVFFAFGIVWLYWFKKRPLIIKTALFSFITFNMLWASFNYFSYGTFMFGNTYRIKNVAKSIINRAKQEDSILTDYTFYRDKESDNQIIYPYDLKDSWNLKEVRAKNINNKNKLIANYIYDFQSISHDFYTTILEERYNFWHNKFNGSNFLSSDTSGLLLARGAYKDMDSRKYIVKEFYSGFDKYFFSQTFKIVDNILFFFRLITNNFLTITVFYIVYFLSLYTFIKNKGEVSNTSFLVFIFSNLYIFNIIVVSLAHSRFLARYSLVCEYLVLLSIYLSIYKLINYLKLKYSTWKLES